MARYTPGIKHFEERHGIARLEKDGFSREQIMKTMYRETEGMKQQDRTELVSKLFDRKEK